MHVKVLQSSVLQVLIFDILIVIFQCCDGASDKIKLLDVRTLAFPSIFVVFLLVFSVDHSGGATYGKTSFRKKKHQNDCCENYVTEPYYALEVAIITTTRLLFFFLLNRDKERKKRQRLL